MADWEARLNASVPDDYKPISFASLMDGIDSQRTQDAVYELVIWHIQRAENAESAIKAFLAKWDLVQPAITAAFQMQQIHGVHYTGPTLADELQAMRDVLAKAEGK